MPIFIIFYLALSFLALSYSALALNSGESARLPRRPISHLSGPPLRGMWV